MIKTDTINRLMGYYKDLHIGNYTSDILNSKQKLIIKGKGYLNLVTTKKTDIEPIVVVRNMRPNNHNLETEYINIRNSRGFMHIETPKSSSAEKGYSVTLTDDRFEDTKSIFTNSFQELKKNNSFIDWLKYVTGIDITPKK